MQAVGDRRSSWRGESLRFRWGLLIQKIVYLKAAHSVREKNDEQMSN
jgi:hypothetical protein